MVMSVQNSFSQPDGRTTSYYQGEPHTFKHYVRSFTQAGGDIKGVVHIAYEDEQAFVVSKTIDYDTTVLQIDTKNNNIISNDEYNASLVAKGDQAAILNSLVTVEYVNTRMGLGNTYNDKNNGPFLQLKGGKLTGKLNIDYTTAAANTNVFEIKGVPTPKDPDDSKKGRRNVLYARTHASGDHVRYNGVIQFEDEITNKRFVDKEIKNLKDDVDDRFVHKTGDTTTGKLGMLFHHRIRGKQRLTMTNCSLEDC